MPDSHILNMPMKTSLPLMSAVRTDRMDAERKLFHYIVNKVDRAFLIMFSIDL